MSILSRFSRGFLQIGACHCVISLRHRGGESSVMWVGVLISDAVGLYWMGVVARGVGEWQGAGERRGRGPKNRERQWGWRAEDSRRAEERSGVRGLCPPCGHRGDVKRFAERSALTLRPHGRHARGTLLSDARPRHPARPRTTRSATLAAITEPTDRGRRSRPRHHRVMPVAAV
jgi:hypothetical protein